MYFKKAGLSRLRDYNINLALDKQVILSAKFIRNKSMAVTKIPSDFFRYPEFMAFVLLPVTWGALPLAGFAPTFYQAYLPPMVYQNLFNAQVSLILNKSELSDVLF